MTTLRENIRRLADEQRNAWEVEGKPLADIANERDFTAEEAEKYERLEGAYNSYDQRINAMLAQQSIEDRLVALRNDTSVIAPHRSGADERNPRLCHQTPNTRCTATAMVRTSSSVR